jgi:hypothetical protein
MQEQYTKSGEWFVKSIVSYRRSQDPVRINQTIGNFQVTYVRASPHVQAELRRVWKRADLGAFPTEAGKS